MIIRINLKSHLIFNNFRDLLDFIEFNNLRTEIISYLKNK